MLLGFGYAFWANYETGHVMPVFGGLGLGCLGIALYTFSRKVGYALRQGRDFWLPLVVGLMLWTVGGVIDVYSLLRENSPLIGSLAFLATAWLGTWHYILQRRRRFTGRFGDPGGH